MTRRLTISLIIGLGLAASPAAVGQIPLSGNVFDGSGGPLASGVVYTVSGTIVVPAGQTLTVGAGAIVKFGGPGQIQVNGTLDVGGTAGSPAVFTAFADDDHGGDTNGDGLSQGVPGSWGKIEFSSTASGSSVRGALIRYGGALGTGFNAVQLVAADIDLADTVIEHSGNDALDLNTDSHPSVTNCDFRDNARLPMDRVPLDAVPAFSGNTASGNGDGDFINLASTPTAADTVIQSVNTLNGVLVGGSQTVSAGTALTIGASVIFKLRIFATITVDGTLVTTGTPTLPVVITSFADDDFGGDTNKDGPSSGATQRWRRIHFLGGADASQLANTVIRFGGANLLQALDLDTADITLASCVVADCAGVGLFLAGNSFPTVTGCLFTGCARAVVAVPWAAVPGFSGNQATLNGENFMEITGGDITSSLSITADNLINANLVTQFPADVRPGVTLTLGAGVVWKFRPGHALSINGTLAATGTPAAPVVFTALADDDFGGDSTGDGPTAGTPGSWANLGFRPTSDASALTSCIVRYAGAAFLPAVDLAESDLTMTDCLVEKAAADLLSLTNNSFPTVTGCAFNEGRVAITQITWAALPGFRHNTAAGSSVGDYASVSGGIVDTAVEVFTYNYPGDVLVAAGSPTIAAGGSLSLDHGVLVKLGPALAFFCSAGSLNLRGTGLEPVVLTSLADDTIGGDTNKDGGATAPAPGDWSRVDYATGAGPSVAEHVLIRYGGRFGLASLECATAAATLRSVRVEHGGGTGFQIADHGGDAIGWVALANAQHGIELTGGGFDVVHATCTGNAARGLRRTVGHAGSLLSSIVFGNTGLNLDGFAAGDVFSSDVDPALAGTNGNISSSPLFVDAAAGDLNLSPGSPCVGAADVAVANAVILDHVEASRRVDADLDGINRPDIGAYERPVFELAFAGQPQRGTTMVFTVSGPPGFAVLLGGILAGDQLALPFGFLTVGTAATVSPIATVPVGLGFPIAFDFPAFLEGFRFGVQAVGFLGADPQVGSFTNRYRGRLFN